MLKLYIRTEQGNIIRGGVGKPWHYAKGTFRRNRTMCEIEIKHATTDDVGQIHSFIKGLAEHVGQSDMVTATQQELTDKIFAENKSLIEKFCFLASMRAGRLTVELIH